MMNSIEALADCIMSFEGYNPPWRGYKNGSPSWRNRNPGNLRTSPYSNAQDDKGYCIFGSLSTGFEALVFDLKAKFNGSHGLTQQNTLHDLFSIYAPVLDSNDPTQYSRVIAAWINEVYNIETVTPETTLEDILKLGQLT
jgi:hypothetical protein